MKMILCAVLMAVLLGCGGSGTSEPEPKCELHKDCPSTTPYCNLELGGRCLPFEDVPVCGENGDCPAGYHCSSEEPWKNVCLGGCKSNADCCPDGEDCGDYECISGERCRQNTSVSDCSECSEGWDCGDPPQCFIEGACTIPEDCSGGQVCVSNSCTACTDDRECPLEQICTPNGVCTDSVTSNDAVNTLCDDNTDCRHVEGGYCSEELNPHRCTISCNNDGNCRSEDFNICNSNGECEGSGA